MQIIIIINSVAGPTMKRALSTIGWNDNAIYYSKHISSFSTVALFCCCYFICLFFFSRVHIALSDGNRNRKVTISSLLQQQQQQQKCSRFRFTVDDFLEKIFVQLFFFPRLVLFFLLLVRIHIWFCSLEHAHFRVNGWLFSQQNESLLYLQILFINLIINYNLMRWMCGRCV